MSRKFDCLRRFAAHPGRRAPAGFTLLEVVMALFIFSVVMFAVAGIFASSFKSYREGRLIAHNLEEAQSALNSIAKVLRTSTVKNSSSTSIEVYDFSQRRCVQYSVSSGNLNVRFGNVTADPDAACAYSTTAIKMLDGYVSAASFDTDPTDDSPNTVGKVTLSLTIRPSSLATSIDRDVQIQTTLSFRDYAQAGFY